MNVVVNRAWIGAMFLMALIMILVVWSFISSWNIDLDRKSENFVAEPVESVELQLFVNANNQALANCSVKLQNLVKTELIKFDVTDLAGLVRFEGFQYGRVHVLLDHPVWGQLEQVLPFNGSPIHVNFKSSAKVGGIVRGAVDGVRSVQLVDKKSGTRALGRVQRKALVEGSVPYEYSLSDLAPGDYLLEVYLLSRMSVHEIEIKKNGVDLTKDIYVTDASIRDTAFTTFTGTVFLDGIPLENTRVQWEAFWPDGLVGHGEMRTDNTGAYRLSIMSRVDPGVRLLFTSEFTIENILEVTQRGLDEEDFDIYLSNSSASSRLVRVVNEEGQPLVGCWANMNREGIGISRRADLNGEVYVENADEKAQVTVFELVGQFFTNRSYKIEEDDLLTLPGRSALITGPSNYPGYGFSVRVGEKWSTIQFRSFPITLLVPYSTDLTLDVELRLEINEAVDLKKMALLTLIEDGASLEPSNRRKVYNFAVEDRWGKPVEHLQFVPYNLNHMAFTFGLPTHGLPARPAFPSLLPLPVDRAQGRYRLLCLEEAFPKEGGWLLCSRGALFVSRLDELAAIGDRIVLDSKNCIFGKVRRGGTVSILSAAGSRQYAICSITGEFCIPMINPPTMVEVEVRQNETSRRMTLTPGIFELIEI